MLCFVFVPRVHVYSFSVQAVEFLEDVILWFCVQNTTL